QRPLRTVSLAGMVLIHHLPGWDEWYREATRKFAHHGYATLSPNLYHREGHGTPEDVAAKVRAAGEEHYVYDVGATREDRGQWERDEGMVCPARGQCVV